MSDRQIHESGIPLIFITTCQSQMLLAAVLQPERTSIFDLVVNLFWVDRAEETNYRIEN